MTTTIIYNSAGAPEAHSNMVGANLIGGHNLPPLVTIGLMYLPKDCRDKYSCPYMFRRARYFWARRRVPKLRTKQHRIIDSNDP